MLPLEDVPDCLEASREKSKKAMCAGSYNQQIANSYFANRQARRLETAVAQALFTVLRRDHGMRQP